MAASTFSHWSRHTRGWLSGGVLIALGLSELLAVQIIRGRVNVLHFVVGLIPIGIGSLILSYNHGKEKTFSGKSSKSISRDMLRAVFDALPSLVFVVDRDMKIHEYNAAASELLKAERKTVLKKRAGDVLYCLHSTEVPEGCGRAPFCKNCIIRNSVTEALKGTRMVRLRTRLDLVRDGKTIELFALITVSPFSFQENERVLLVIEDISEIVGIQRLIPVCSLCRKVRDDQDAWMQIETYFKNNWDVDFSHGYCPDCAKIEIGRTQAVNKS